MSTFTTISIDYQQKHSKFKQDEKNERVCCYSYVNVEKSARCRYVLIRGFRSFRTIGLSAIANVSKYARSVSGGFLYTLEACLVNLGYPKNYLSVRMSQGNFGRQESFSLLFLLIRNWQLLSRTSWARSIQPTFRPVRPGKEDHLKRWTCFSKLFRLDRTDPLSFGPKFPEILVEWIAPLAFIVFYCIYTESFRRSFFFFF